MILKGMANNQEKVEKDLFAQRLKQNCIMKHKDKNTEMNLDIIFTDYLNGVVSKLENTTLVRFELVLHSDRTS